MRTDRFSRSKFDQIIHSGTDDFLYCKQQKTRIDNLDNQIKSFWIEWTFKKWERARNRAPHVEIWIIVVHFSKVYFDFQKVLWFSNRIQLINKPEQSQKNIQIPK